MLLVVIGLGLLAACARTSVYQQPVKAGSPISFTLWRADADDVLTPQERAWLDLALQEFKFQIMQAGRVTGSEAIDAALREKIDGIKLIEVMRDGLQLRLKRYTSDKADLERSIQINSQTRISPDEKDALDKFQRNLTARLANMNEEITSLDAALKQLEAKAR